MRTPRAIVSLIRGAAVALPALLAACGPFGDPEVAAEEERPCHADADCEMHAGESATRHTLCSSVGTHGSQSDISGKDGAACGPMPNMAPSMPEPDLVCFRGTCIPVGTRR